ncbi:hypothetical protein JCM6882_005570 [Rhodosporidiobolus microsporus]
MMVYSDEPEQPPSRRTGLNRFKPKRLSFFGNNSSSSRASTSSSSSTVSPSPSPSPSPTVVPPPRTSRPIVIAPAQPRAPPPSMKRKTAPSPYVADAPVFTSPFTNLSPFTSPPLPPTPGFNPGRRLSSEARAIAANRVKSAILSVDTAPGKRRKSVVDLEEATEGVKNLSARRRSSLTPIQPLSAAPRASLVQYTPANPDLLENSPRPSTSGHIRAPSGVRIGFPLTFPSPVPGSPLAERRAAFSDDVASPIISSPDPPARPFSYARPSSPTTSIATSGSVRSSTYTLTPRSPHAMSPRDLAPELSEGPRGHRRTPSGVPISWPPVFPSRPSSMAFSTTSVDDEEKAEEDDAEEELAAGSPSDDEEEDLAEEKEEIPISLRPTPPSFIRRVPPPTLASASPFPPPFLSPSTRTASDDSFRNFSFPSMPTLFPRTPTALPPSTVRRISTCSSYESGQGSDAIKTPSTLEWHAHTPLGTGQTIYEGNPFAEAFGQAGGSALARLRPESVQCV